MTYIYKIRKLMKGTYVRRSMVSSHVNIYEVSIKFVVTKPPKLVKMVIASQNKLFFVLFALHVLTFAFPTEARRLSTKASSHLVHVDQNENKGLTLFKRVRFGMLAKIPILPPYNLVRKILFMCVCPCKFLLTKGLDPLGLGYNSYRACGIFIFVKDYVYIGFVIYIYIYIYSIRVLCIILR